ncbi:unnamed protein product [Moneuplotes crassus]|uniref:Uncharacterized protein n=1 Tax=Euplotes crassus TaxID=5936 RepID=A0AAD1Y6N3_EUPCR|nr:unnamed protein product [Moneuplotes crassus]
MCVCAVCANTIYADEEIEAITNANAIEDTIRIVDHHLKKIDRFREKHNLNIVWERIIPELTNFIKKKTSLQARLLIITKKDMHGHLNKLQYDAKDLLNTIYKSNIMKHYSRQLQCRQFAEDLYGDVVDIDTRSANAKTSLSTLNEKVIDVNIEDLKREFAENPYFAQEYQAQLDALEEEKVSFEESLEALTQDSQEIDSKIETRDEELRCFKEKFINFEEEESNLSTKADKISNEYNSLVDLAFEAKEPISFSDYADIWENVSGNYCSWGESDELAFNMSYDEKVEVLKALLSKKLPNFSKVMVYNYSLFQEQELIDTFLKGSISNHIEYFVYGNLELPEQPGEAHIEALKKAVARVPQILQFDRLHLNKKEFEDLMIASKGCNEIVFDRCKFILYHYLYFLSQSLSSF